MRLFSPLGKLGTAKAALQRGRPAPSQMRVSRTYLTYPVEQWHVVDSDKRLRSSPNRPRLPAQRANGDYYQSDVTAFGLRVLRIRAVGSRICEPDGARPKSSQPGAAP
jgi:hypothetical protein